MLSSLTQSTPEESKKHHKSYYTARNKIIKNTNHWLYGHWILIPVQLQNQLV